MILTRYNNLTQRLVTGLTGSAVIAFCVVYSEWTYFGIFFTICLLVLYEFYTLLKVGGIFPQKMFGMIYGMILFSLSFFIERGNIPHHYYFLAFPLASCTYMLKLYSSNDANQKPFNSIAHTLLGIFYVVIPFCMLHAMAYENEVYNFQIMMGCLLILWAGDSGAYIAGTLFGKRKLFKSISPQKSWEGAIGGAFLAACFALISAQFFNSLEAWQWYIIAFIIIFGGIYGDLVESLLKRSLNIKDSGISLPGHGGFLDRFDGLLLSSPLIVAFLKIF